MIINSLERCVNLKIVYYGPALSGKTTSISSLFDQFGKRDEILNIENTLKRTLFFDYGTLSFQNEFWKLKIHIYSTTGQDFYKITRPIVLRTIDGIIFIIDSQKSAYDRNIQSWNELNYYFKDNIEKLPVVFCFNKQDLSEKFKSAFFLNQIDFHKLVNYAVEYTVALNGDGILNSFENALKLVFQDLTNSELLMTEGTSFFKF